MSDLTDATPAERHRRLAAEFLAVAEGVTDWAAPTPVPEWRAVDIVTHLSWLPGMLSGMGVDLAIPESADPIEQLRNQTTVVQERLDGPAGDELIDTQMFGQLPFAQVVDRFYSFDLYAHRWDLAKASGQAVLLDAEYAAQAYAGMSAMGEELHASGQFGTPQPVADDASPQEQLLALIGRNPNWEN